MNFSTQFDSFHEMAAAAIGLSDFGPDDYHKPLKLLLSNYDNGPNFSETGAGLTAGDVVGHLIGRLLAQQGFKTYPQFAAAKIVEPIIIMGMPRTGSTALHRLLSQDPGTQSLELWLGAMPMPRPPRAAWDEHPVYRQIKQQIDQLYAMSPDLRRMHPVFPDQADECRFAIDQTFWSPGMAATASVPEYGQWCLSTDAGYAYRRYRQILSLIAGGDARRWVLKNPDHLFALEALLEVFPDACIVQTHRDPALSLASVSSMSYEVLRMREPERSRWDHGRNMRMWIQALEKAEAVRKRFDPARFFDLHIDEIQTDQVGVVERIYAHFGLPVSDTARAAWRNRASSDPKSGHGSHEYGLETFGVSPTEIESLAPLYCERYSQFRKKLAA